MLLFTCQIYVDFSSYSDIAIGLGLLLGYHIRPNFNLPFVVPSIPERWRRWHISMSHWFRDYIFIPLGGSRKGTVRTQVNIVLVMFLSGLWHGASNNFVVWGLGNGMTMVGHKLLRRPLKWMSGLMEGSVLTRVGYYYLCCWNTFCMIATINIFFRCPDWKPQRAMSEAYLEVVYLPIKMPSQTSQSFRLISRMVFCGPLQSLLSTSSNGISTSKTRSSPTDGSGQPSVWPCLVCRQLWNSRSTVYLLPLR